MGPFVALARSSLADYASQQEVAFAAILGHPPKSMAECSDDEVIELARTAGLEIEACAKTSTEQMINAVTRKRKSVIDCNFHAIAGNLFYGSTGLGRGKLCPRDRREGCSFVDALQPNQKGIANLFLSWAWSYTLDTVTDGLRSWASHNYIDPAATFVWICAFCNNQYRTLDGSYNLEDVFRPRLRACGRAVALLDTWDSPLYVKRVWCVFEASIRVWHCCIPPGTPQTTKFRKSRRSCNNLAGDCVHYSYLVFECI